ncbi:MAG: acetamidase/formamidase family protein [Gammaproteobacteria bacterium]|nr:acetamidase/formamidase family protein [Gammaproteobacteria bacterium]
MGCVRSGEPHARGAGPRWLGAAAPRRTSGRRSPAGERHGTSNCRGRRQSPPRPGAQPRAGCSGHGAQVLRRPGTQLSRARSSRGASHERKSQPRLRHPPQTHRLEATPATVAYGYYWSQATPVLHIDSGDIIDVDTLLTNSPAGLERAGVAPERIQSSLKAVESEVTGERRGPGGHILTGPVYVEGAEPGDVLEVKILAIDLAIDYGYNGCSGVLPQNCEPGVPVRIIALDKRTMTAEFLPGIVIPLKPFFGSMGVAPAPELGRVSSNPPGRHAGNLDNRELIVGSTLYIPVFARGALFEIGDRHVAQGDGEVDQTAIETSLRGHLQLTVRKDMKLSWPRAETPTDFISMATDPDLATATRTAIQEMIDFLVRERKLTRHQAYQLVSIAGNVAITQLVDKPNVGVHVRLPKSIFR